MSTPSEKNSRARSIRETYLAQYPRRMLQVRLPPSRPTQAKPVSPASPPMSFIEATFLRLLTATEAEEAAFIARFSAWREERAIRSREVSAAATGSPTPPQPARRRA